MGQLADDMIDGTTCELCGMFFIDAAAQRDDDDDSEAPLYTHGHPAVCWECWQDLTKRERRHHVRAIKPTL